MVLGQLSECGVASLLNFDNSNHSVFGYGNDVRPPLHTY